MNAPWGIPVGKTCLIMLENKRLSDMAYHVITFGPSSNNINSFNIQFQQII